MVDSFRRQKSIGWHGETKSALWPHILSNGPAKKQAEKPQAAAIASVIFEALISLIKLNLNALIGQRSEKREI